MIRCVSDAARASCKKGSCLVSLIHKQSNPSCSAFFDKALASEGESTAISASIFMSPSDYSTALKLEPTEPASVLRMATLTVLFGLTAAFCWGSSDYLSRRQSEKVGTYKTVVYAHVMTLVVLLALIPVLRPAFEVGPVVALALTAAGLVNFLAFILLYRAFHKGVVSVVAPVAYTFPVATTVLSIVLLGIALSASSIVAIAWIIAGVLLLSTRLSELRASLARKGAPNVTVGIGSAVGASVFFGIAYVGLGYSIALVGYVLPTIILRGVATAAGFLLAPLLKQEVRPSRSAFSNTIVVMGILEAIGFLAFSYGVSQGSSSLPVIAAVSGMGGAVAAAYGLVFLRERLELNQVIGVFLALTGVFFLLYLGG